MTGQTGNDTYIVDSFLDAVVESDNEGTDFVQSSVNHTLAINTEHLTLTGAAALSGVGNALANVIVGNSAANVLSGAGGADFISGGGGDDTYVGGTASDVLVDDSATSNDVYQWGRGDGTDVLSDAGGGDRLEISDGASTDQVWFTRSGSDLEVSLIGTGDEFTIKDWYAGTAHQVESFRLADGYTLMASSVNQLVDAMASFAPPAAGETTLPSSYREALGSTIAANWQPPAG